MSTEQTNSPAEPSLDTATPEDLDSFAAELFGESPKPSDNAKSEEPSSPSEEDSDANIETEQDTHSAENGAEDEEADEADKSDEPTDDGEPKAKQPKNRYQERINELTAKARQAERERDELLKKLEEKNKDPEPKEQASDVSTDTGPSPTDKNEDGTDKYPLGEFDPKFQADLVKFTVQKTLDEDRAQRETREKENAKLSAEEQYRETLQGTWNEKLELVQERYPDYQEKGQQLLSVFEDIEPAYGQYLADTLMEMDAGPEVFYYLSSNLEEAKEIVDAGPRRATIALDKIEAQLAGTKATQAPKIKVSNAPEPPPQVKGSAVSKSAIPLDTDDLDAFEKVLFTKK